MAGDKNKVAQTEGDCDLIAKVGHGILKAIYTSQTGCRNWIIRDGATVCPATGCITVASPVANTFSCAAISLCAVLEERSATGTITPCAALEEVVATGTITMANPTGQEHASQSVTFMCSTIEATSCATITLACVLAAQNVTINDLQYNAVCGAMCAVCEFDISGTDTAAAADLNCAIQNDTRCGMCVCGVTTAVCAAVVTVTSVVAALASNCLILSASDATFTLSACGFTGGKDADNVTVNGLIYTATCGAHGCFLLFDISVSDNAASTDLTLSVDCDARACANLVDATSSCAVTTVRAVTAGAAGNCFSLATNAICCTIAVGSCTFACGVTGDFVTLNGLVYTANVGAAADFTEFCVSCGNNCDATNLAAAVCCDTRCGCLSDLSAGSSCAIVTVTDKNACCMGACGNSIAMLTSCATTLCLSGATLSGGNTACTVTINGLVYTAVCGVGCTAAGEFSTDTDDCATATDLATRINCDARMGCLEDVTAAVCMCACDTVLVTASCSGTSANSITMVTACMTRLALGCCNATLTGGNDVCTVTINGLIYTAVEGAGCTAAGEFSTDTSDTATATDLATRICCDARCGTTGDLSATSCTAIVTVTTDVCGVAGDAITIVSDCMTRINVGCGFEGGVDADIVTINNLIYTAVVGARCGETQFSIDGSDCATATDLAAAITADCRFPCCVTVPTHDVNAAATMCVVLVTADNGTIGSCIDLTSSSATRLLTTGAGFLTGGLGTEVIEIDLVGATSGEISMPYFNHPMADGIFVEFIAGTSGRLTLIFE